MLQNLGQDIKYLGAWGAQTELLSKDLWPPCFALSIWRVLENAVPNLSIDKPNSKGFIMP